MSRTRLLVIGSILVFAMTKAPMIMVAQQTTVTRSADGVPAVEDQMKLLTPRLGLTTAQQPKVRSILQDLLDGTQKLALDGSISNDERMDGVRALRYKTDERLRAMLGNEQKKKLDQVEQEPHAELHGDVR